MRATAGRRHDVGSDVLKGEATGKQQLVIKCIYPSKTTASTEPNNRKNA